MPKVASRGDGERGRIDYHWPCILRSFLSGARTPCTLPLPRGVESIYENDRVLGIHCPVTCGTPTVCTVLYLLYFRFLRLGSTQMNPGPADSEPSVTTAGRHGPTVEAQAVALPRLVAPSHAFA